MFGKFLLSNRGKSMLFSQLCVFHHCEAGGFQSDSVALIRMDSSSYLKKAKKFTTKEDGLLGKVLIGNANEPICVPGNSALTIPGRLGKNTKVPNHTLAPLIQLL